MDMNLEITNAYAGPNHITAGIQHGSSDLNTKVALLIVSSLLTKL